MPTPITNNPIAVELLELPPYTTPAMGDILYVLATVGGNPVDVYVTRGNLLGPSLVAMASGLPTGRVWVGNGSNLPVAGTIPTFIGDSGSGGVAGAVPAPLAGDGALNKYLRADGTWTTVHASGGGGGGGGIADEVTFSSVTTLTITHNLNQHVLIQVMDTSGNQIECGVHQTANSFTLTFSEAQSGRVIYATGSGTVTVTLPDIPTNTIVGRHTAGTGAQEALTPTQVTSMLNAFSGDTGGGGAKGLVPAPTAGDAAANKFLMASGTWHVIPTTATLVGDSGSGGIAGLAPAPAAGDHAAGKFLSAGGDYAVPSTSAGSFVLGGVPGGQVAYGGTLTGNRLVLHANTVDSIGTVEIASTLAIHNLLYFQNAGNTSTSSISWASFNCVVWFIPGGSNTPIITAPPGVSELILKIVQPSGGTLGTVTWPAGIRWPGGVAPTLTATHSAVDLVRFFFDGSTFYGVFWGNMA